ncbi:hypothetical protein B0T16DRAFT_453922 [Cercophora newfieldiana]|uniref:DUF1763-domain-containing protein n=1 Tax=Cercophora newfieldiana TaxID=92897 RepID=A0AA39YH70_9PEZI|nr:hypothetical protein B0T16DRAFT_453922 [Cercophora newfieldiana]
MASTLPTKTDILTSYRHLLRAALRAVHYAHPQRFVVRDVMREAFRDAKAIGTYDRKRIRNTIFFLNTAAREAGLETDILKNLVRVAWERRNLRGRRDWHVLMKEKEMEGRKKKNLLPDPIKGREYEHYERTIAMLNDMMELCLR